MLKSSSFAIVVIAMLAITPASADDFALTDTVSDVGALGVNPNYLAAASANDMTATSGDSELQMVELQSIVSQRQLAVQMTTSLMNSLYGDGCVICDNIGR